MTIKKNAATRQAPQKKNKKSKKKPPEINNHFPIVGIGASAGGLEAISELLMNLPPDTGMAFVIVQHLDPTHESMIGEILSRKTLMPVTEIKNNVHIEPNHVYVIPPNTSLTISHGACKILPRSEKTGAHLPIDSFLTSLAKDQKNKCIGIILSGTASDGTFGLEAIKTEGGFTIAQDPKSAKYDGMPRSAIAAGMVDLVLSPKKIGEELARIARHPLIRSEEPNLALSTQDLGSSDVEGYFRKILTLLQSKCQVDFSHYKRNTLNRRISRRMVLKKTKHLREYYEYLVKNPDEVKCLYDDILINVTEFFRNPNAFAQLKAKILPTLLHDREANSPIRIWVVGCATGEEAYSVTMSLLESIGDPITKQRIQVFATDISESAIQKARVGIYPASISKNVSKERLEQFFTKTETGSYRIKNYVRDMCLFAWHDVTSDPPYAKLDLICCRNLLIYFDQTLQEHVLPILHYALKFGGFLWLGNSESIGKLPSLFELIDKTNKFYIRKSTPSIQKFHFSASTHIPERLEIIKRSPEQATSSSIDIVHETDHIAALQYAPPGVVVNDVMEIVLIRGDISPYLQLTHGQPSFNLFKMAPAELAADLRMAIRMAKKKNGMAHKGGCTLQTGGKAHSFSIDIVPFTFTQASQIKERYFLISFAPEQVTPAGSPFLKPSEKSNQRADSQDIYIKELEKEQTDSKSYQKSLIQDFEITQEELTSTNEELQTTIEELQSTNEELETAKEELQSANEELTTVNDELQSRNTELSKLNDDLVNLLGCVDIPIVMVGMDGCVRRFTPKAGKMLNLIRTDIGRPISDINPNFDRLDLGSLVAEVIDTIAIKEMSIQDRKGRWFRLQIRPYKTTENKIDGAVIALVDINRLKQNLLESEASLDYVNSIANTVHLPLVVLDKQLRLKSANHAFYTKFKASMHDLGKNLLSLIGVNKQNVSTTRETLIHAFSTNTELSDFSVEYTFSPARSGTLQFNGRRIKWIDDEEPNALLLSIQDITDRLKMEESLKEAIDESRKANQAKDLFLATLSHELRTPLTAILCWVQILLKMEEGTEKFKHGLESIEQNSKIQGQLIDDLLDVSRIQSGKIVLSIAKINPGKVVHAAIESIRPLAEKKSVIIKTHISSLNGKVVAADTSRLKQIIWNLLINAIKFSPIGKTISIYVKPITKKRRHFVTIQVKDQGKGIKPEFLPLLFERFTQADSTTTRLHGGLGLGLTIASDLLKLLGGSIQAKSAGEGKGSTFTVLLPLIQQGVKLKKTPTKKQTSTSQQLKGLSILIVEDEQNSLVVFAKLLKIAGAKTISASSADEAIIALNNKPDILISDIAMPGKDGISLIKTIRAREKKEGAEAIPAIALTAYTTKADIKRAISAGFNAHVAKPFNAADLILCIKTVAAGRRK